MLPMPNFKIENDEILAYEFETYEPITVSDNMEIESDEVVEEFISADLFRLELDKETEETRVFVANEDDFYIHEDATYLFGAELLLDHFNNCKNVPNLTGEYEEWLEMIKEED